MRRISAPAAAPTCRARTLPDHVPGRILRRFSASAALLWQARSGTLPFLAYAFIIQVLRMLSMRNPPGEGLFQARHSRYIAMKLFVSSCNFICNDFCSRYSPDIVTTSGILHPNRLFLDYTGVKWKLHLSRKILRKFLQKHNRSVHDHNHRTLQRLILLTFRVFPKSPCIYVSPSCDIDIKLGIQ